MTLTIKERLEQLEKKKGQLETKIKDLNTIKHTQEKKRDTRRKIIAGALVLKHHKLNSGNDPFSKKLARLIDEYVVKPRERELFKELFNLPDRPEDSQDAANDSGSPAPDLKQDFQSNG